MDENFLTGVGVFICSVAVATIGTATLVWSRRRRNFNKIETKISPTKSRSVSDCSVNEPNFEEFNQHLQNDLKNHILDEIDLVKKDIEEKRREMKQKIESSLSDKEEEMSIIEAKYSSDKKEVETKYKVEIDLIKKQFETEIKQLNENLKKFKVNLCFSVDHKERVDDSRSELECPVCMEEMKPPRRIWQCSDGHPVCEPCKKKPEVTCCPTCRKYLVGRSTIAEKLARSLFDAGPGAAAGGATGAEVDTEKLTLTGYRAVKIVRDY